MTIDNGPSNNAATAAASSEADKIIRRASTYDSKELRLSRLQASEFHLDIDDLTDDGVIPDEQIIHDAHFKQGETETIRKVLNETEVIALKRTSEGFNEINFSIGVLNCFLISYMIGAYPQHLWLLYFIESFYMIPRKFYNMWHAKPLNQALYYLDFCWCMNFLALIFLLVLMLSELLGLTVEDDARATCFKASMGAACGVLLSANIVLPFVACLFHDLNSMTGLFIHLMPPLVMYTFMWYNSAIVDAWPQVFSFSYMDDIRYFGGVASVAGSATALYFMWWTFYVSFMLLVGINLPKKFKPNGEEAHPRWDTVFHSTMRQGVCVAMGKTLRGRQMAESLKQMEENNFDLVDFFLYMVAHMVCSLGAIYTVGYGCFSNKFFHLAMLGASAVLAVVRGAKRYTYYSTKMYTRALRKEFSHLIDEDVGKVHQSSQPQSPESAAYTRMT